MDLKKFEGSVSQHEFIQGLMLARSETNTPGHIWERNVNCTNCLFAKTCSIITGTLYPKQQPRCRDIINLLLGEIKVEDIK